MQEEIYYAVCIDKKIHKNNNGFFVPTKIIKGYLLGDIFINFFNTGFYPLCKIGDGDNQHYCFPISEEKLLQEFAKSKNDDPDYCAGLYLDLVKPFDFFYKSQFDPTSIYSVGDNGNFHRLDPSSDFLSQQLQEKENLILNEEHSHSGYNDMIPIKRMGGN